MPPSAPPALPWRSSWSSPCARGITAALDARLVQRIIAPAVDKIDLPLTPNRLLRLAELDAVVRHLRRGGLVVLPTETGYLLGAAALDGDAVRRVFAVKVRSPRNPMHAAVTGVEMAEQLAHLEDAARYLLRIFTPGPLTVVCPKRETVPDILVAGTGTLGIRVPDSPITLQVIAALGGPITATSLNVSGDPPRASVDETIAALEWKEEPTLFVVKDPLCVLHSRPSTLVSLVDGGCVILRDGPITAEEITAALSVGAEQMR
jgi:L-threonylcarbamoyladenylate synthase